jgi:hypothetical protein
MYFLESDTFVMRLGRVCKAWSADLSGAEWGAAGTSTQRPHVVSARETFSPQGAHTALAAAATEACTCVHFGRLRPSAPPGVSADVSIGRSRVDDPRHAQTLSGGTLASCSNTSLACPQRVRHDAAPVRSHRALTSLLHRRRCCCCCPPPLCAECAPCSMLAKRVVLLLLLACMPEARQHVSQASPTPSLTPPHSAAPPPSRHRGHGVLYMCMYMHMYVLLLAMGIPGVAGTVTLPVGMPPSNPSYPRPCYGPPLGLPPLTGLPQASPL